MGYIVSKGISSTVSEGDVESMPQGAISSNLGLYTRTLPCGGGSRLWDTGWNEQIEGPEKMGVGEMLRNIFRDKDEGARKVL